MSAILLRQSVPSVTNTKPRKLRLGVWFCEPMSWADAMVLTAKALLNSVQHREKLLANIHTISGIGAVSAVMRSPEKLKANLYIDRNKSANDCLRMIVTLLKSADYPLEETSVEFDSEYSYSSRVLPEDGKTLFEDSKEKLTKATSDLKHKVYTQVEQAFRQYMESQVGKSPKTAENYIQGMRKVSKILVELGVVKKDVGELVSSMDKLSDAMQMVVIAPEFISIDRRGNRMYSSSIKSFLSFAAQYQNRHPSQDNHSSACKDISFPVSQADTPHSASSITSHTEENSVEKIGVYAKRELYSALAEGRIPEEDFAKLLTMEGTKELLGISLNGCPLFGLSHLVDNRGRIRCWRLPSVRNRVTVYVAQEWYEKDRPKLVKLLSRWRNNDNKTKPQDVQNENQHAPLGINKDLMGNQEESSNENEHLIDEWANSVF